MSAVLLRVSPFTPEKTMNVSKKNGKGGKGGKGC